VERDAVACMWRRSDKRWVLVSGESLGDASPMGGGEKGGQSVRRRVGRNAVCHTASVSNVDESHLMKGLGEGGGRWFLGPREKGKKETVKTRSNNADRQGGKKVAGIKTRRSTTRRKER